VNRVRRKTRKKSGMSLEWYAAKRIELTYGKQRQCTERKAESSLMRGLSELGRPCALANGNEFSESKKFCQRRVVNDGNVEVGVVS